MVGTLWLCPLNISCISRNDVGHGNNGPQFCPTGKSAEMLSSPARKNKLLRRNPKSPLQPAPSRTRQEGRIAIVTDVGRGMRWTRTCRTDERRGARTVKSCGSDIPTLISSRPRCFRIVACDGGKKARSPGRARRKPLKPLRRECRVNPAATAVTTLVCFFIFAREAAGAAKRPAFPAPSHFGRSGFASARAHRAARSRSHGCDVAV